MLFLVINVSKIIIYLSKPQPVKECIEYAYKREIVPSDFNCK